MSKRKRSDFSLFPIKHIGKKYWEYRPATWPIEMDVAVHKLFDKKRNPPLHYIRKKRFNGKFQNCSIEKDDEYGFIVKPGDGYNFLIRRDTFHNKEVDLDDLPFDQENLSPDTFFPKEVMKKIIKMKKKKKNPNGPVLTDLKCLICLTNNRDHVVPGCFHVIACKDCAKNLPNHGTCPICRKHYTEKLKKLFY